MEHSVIDLGSTSDGTAVSAVAVTNKNQLAIQAMSYGATLTSVKVQGVELTLGFDDLAGWQANPAYFGSTVGRFANRINGGRFVLDGVTHQLVANRGAVHLHGGDGGFSYRHWAMRPVVGEGYAGATFTRVSGDGEEHYPGELSVTVQLLLTEDNLLVFDYRATTTKPTPINLTNHTYWNLKGEGVGDILDHDLRLWCPQYLPLTAELVPTGEIAPVSAAMDFRNAKPVGQDIGRVAGGYDHCYLLPNPTPGDLKPDFAVPLPLHSALRKVADLSHAKVGRGMAVWTTKPAVQFYAGNMLDGLIGRRGHSYQARSGLCLETQYYPDAPNQRNFPSCILSPGAEYRHTTVHAFRW